VSTDVEQLSCRELVELVTDYLEGALSEEERLRFDEHIGTCNGCRVYLEQMRQTIVVAGHLSEEWLAPDAERELLQVFRGWRSG
jgi:anti-sigma factor RsiW